MPAGERSSPLQNRPAFGREKKRKRVTESSGHRTPPENRRSRSRRGGRSCCGKRNGRNLDCCTKNRPAEENDYHSHFLSRHFHPSAHHHNYRAKYRHTIPIRSRAYRTNRRHWGEIVPRESFLFYILLVTVQGGRRTIAKKGHQNLIN